MHGIFSLLSAEYLALSADVEQNHCATYPCFLRLQKDLVEENENGGDFSIPVLMLLALRPLILFHWGLYRTAFICLLCFWMTNIMAGKIHEYFVCFWSCIFIISAILVGSNFSRDKRLINVPLEKDEEGPPNMSVHSDQITLHRISFWEVIEQVFPSSLSQALQFSDFI